MFVKNGKIAPDFPESTSNLGISGGDFAVKNGLSHHRYKNGHHNGNGNGVANGHGRPSQNYQSNGKAKQVRKKKRVMRHEKKKI